MTNPNSGEGWRPIKESSLEPETKLSAMPKIRILAWLLVALVTLAGIIFYFVYGDHVTPMLVLRDAIAPLPAPWLTV